MYYNIQYELFFFFSLNRCEVYLRNMKDTVILILYLLEKEKSLTD